MNINTEVLKKKLANCCEHIGRMARHEPGRFLGVMDGPRADVTHPINTVKDKNHVTLSDAESI